MDDRDRRSRARAGDRSRAFYTATNGRPGPVVIAIPEDMLVERIAVPDAPAFAAVETSPGPAAMAKFAEMLSTARAPIMLLGGSRWSQDACDRLARFAQKYSTAGLHDVPPRPSVRPDASLLRRRRRHRPQSKTARTRQIIRSRRSDRRTARRTAVAALHAARYSRPADAVRPRASGSGGTRPRLQSASGDPCNADSFHRGARRLEICARAGGRRRGRERRLSRLDRQADRAAGRA